MHPTQRDITDQSKHPERLYNTKRSTPPRRGNSINPSPNGLNAKTGSKSSY